MVGVPEVATIVRWLLRVVLVAFLFWLVKGRQEQEEEEEPEEAEPDWQKARQAQPRNGQRPQQRNSGDRGTGQAGYRQAPRNSNEQAYGQRDMRQRRPVGGESTDFDSVINKMSKPKQMWQVQKDDKPPQILKQDNSTDVADSGPKASSQSKEPKDSGQSNSRRTEEASPLLKKSMLHGHMRPVTWITWNRDGNLLFTCGKDKKVCVWSFPDGECLGSYEGHSGAVWACSVTADSSWLVSGGADQNVIVWEARASRELARIELPGVCRFVEWASTGGSDGERFATAHNKFSNNPPALTIFRFDGENIEQQLRIDGLPGPTTQVRWGRGDLTLVSAHENGELVFWKADTGAEVRQMKVHEALISKFDFSTDRLLIATASTDMKVKVWDLGEEDSDPKLLFETETDRPLNAVALGPFTRASVRDAHGELAGCLKLIAGGGQDIREVAMSKGTEAEFDTLVFKVGAANLEATGSIKGHFGPVHTLAISSDGSAMASGSEDGCVRLHLFNDTGSSK